MSCLRLHDYPAEKSAEPSPLSSFGSPLDSISDAPDTDTERRNQERERRGLGAVSETLETNLEAAVKGDTDIAFQMLAHHERELQEYRQAENDDTYRRIFWVFYEPAAEALNRIATHERWPLLTDLIDACSRESDDEPFVGPVIENAVEHHVVRTRRHDGVGTVSAEALAYLGSFWDSNKDASWGGSFTYGWGAGYPEYSVGEQLQDAVTGELFWTRGVFPHAFYTDQHAAANLMDTLLNDEQIDYEDRYLLASVLSEIDRDSAPKVPRYRNTRDELDNRFKFSETVRSQLWNTIKSKGLHRQLGKGWTFTDMDL